MVGQYISKTDVLGYFLSLSDGFSVEASSQALLELIVIGRIPLTSTQINFEIIFVSSLVAIWLFTLTKLAVVAIRKLDKINFQNYIEQIAL